MGIVYTRILVPLENSPYDDAILAHVRLLARLSSASILLIHVADGWAARNMAQLELRESEEMRGDREYLKRITDQLEKEGFNADLIAMSTHGHRFIKDLIFGSVAESVRHRCTIPVLLVRGSRDSGEWQAVT
jgi:nucleotide-binding universal stress UspA family protein